MTVAAALIGWRFGGIDGACWVAGIVAALSFGVSLSAHLRIKEALDLVVATNRENHTRPETIEIGDDGLWQDIRRFLVRNPNISPSNLDGERSAVLWAFKTMGQIPTSDMALLGLFQAYVEAHESIWSGGRTLKPRVAPGPN